MKKRFIKSLAALSSAVMLFGAVAQPVDYSFKFENNSSIMTADAAAYPTGAYGGKFSYQCADGAWIYFNYVDYNGEKAVEVSGSYFIKETSLNIPDTVNLQGKDYDVIGIGKNAFKGQKNLIYIYSMGNNLKYIDENAFMDCTELNYISFTNRNGLNLKLDSIGQSSFRNCNNLTDINIYSVKNIGDYAFYDCIELKSYLTLDSSCTSIGRYAFANCSLLSINLSDTRITTIPDYAFHSNRAAEEIILPETITSIGNAAFCYCQNMKSIDIPDAVTKIEANAFAYCNALTTVIIPKETTEVGKYAFWCCDSMKNFICKNPNTKYGSYAFGYTAGKYGTATKLKDITLWGNGESKNTTLYYYYEKRLGFNYKDISKLLNTCLTQMEDYSWKVENIEKNFGVKDKNGEWRAILDKEHHEYADKSEDKINNNYYIKNKILNGNCFGMVLTSMLLKNEYMDNNKSTHLSEDITAKDIKSITKSFVNILQYNQLYIKEFNLLSKETLNDIECLAYENKVGMIVYNNNNNKHAVTCLGLEYYNKDIHTKASDWKQTYKQNSEDRTKSYAKEFDARILLDDPNYSGFEKKSYVYVDTKDGSWVVKDSIGGVIAYYIIGYDNNVYQKDNNPLDEICINKIGFYNYSQPLPLSTKAVNMLKYYGCTHPSIS